MSLSLSLTLGLSLFRPPAAAKPAGAEPLPRAAIRQVIRSHAGALVTCYQRADRPAGKIVLRFTVGADGSVPSAELAPETTLREPAVTACLVDLFRTFRFPKPGRDVRVTYPLWVGYPESDVRSSWPGAQRESRVTST